MPRAKPKPKPKPKHKPTTVHAPTGADLSDEEAEFKCRRLLSRIQEWIQEKSRTKTPSPPTTAPAPQDLLRLEESLQGLCILSRNARAKSHLLQFGLAPLREILIFPHHEAIAAVHQSCCDLAWTLCYHDASAQHLFARLRIVSCILQVARQNMGNVKLLKSALGALSSLCRHTANQRLAAEGRASSFVIGILNLKGFGDATLCQYAIDATASFSHGNAASADAFLKARGAAVLVDALKRSCGSATFVRSVCILMVVLRERNGGPAAIVESGAIEALLQASRQHLGMQEIQHILCALIGQLARDFSVGVVPRVWTQEGISTILQILCQFPKHLLIVEACTLLLAHGQSRDEPRHVRAETGPQACSDNPAGNGQLTEESSEACRDFADSGYACRELDWDAITMKSDVEGLLKALGSRSGGLRPGIGRYVLMTLGNLGKCGWMTLLFSSLQCLCCAYAIVCPSPLELIDAFGVWSQCSSMQDVTRMGEFVLHVVVHRRSPKKSSRLLHLKTSQFSRAEIKQRLMALARTKVLANENRLCVGKVVKGLLEAEAEPDGEGRWRDDSNQFAVLHTVLVHVCLVLVASGEGALEEELWPQLFAASLRWLQGFKLDLSRSHAETATDKEEKAQGLGWTVCTLLLLGLAKARHATLRILAQKNGVSELLEARQLWLGRGQSRAAQCAANAVDTVLMEISRTAGDEPRRAPVSIPDAVDEYFESDEPERVERPGGEKGEKEPQSASVAEVMALVEKSPVEADDNDVDDSAECAVPSGDNYSDTSSEEDPAERPSASDLQIPDFVSPRESASDKPALQQEKKIEIEYPEKSQTLESSVSSNEEDERAEDARVDDVVATRVRENDPAKRCFAVELPLAVYDLPTVCEPMLEEGLSWGSTRWAKWDDSVLVYDWRYSQGQGYGLARTKLPPAVPYTPSQNMPLQEDTIEQSPLLEDYLGSGDFVRFESRFECGNLLQAIRVGKHEYDLILRSDINTQGHHQWFFFGVAHTHASESGANETVRIRFNIVNLLKPSSMFSQGMQPVHFSFNRARRDKIGWRRLGESVTYMENAHQADRKRKYHTLSFTASFTDPSDKHLFAMCYPYSYSALQRDLHKLTAQALPQLHRRLLCQTLNGLRCDLLTITDSQPSGIQGKMPVVVFTGRVHPGEVNASLMMDGTIRFLLGRSPLARALRQSVVFKVVPMLNPDGVFYGNTRVSLAGVDLNRQWAHPDAALNPTIFHVKQLIRQEDVALYIDFHGHSRKRNVFLYGVEDRRNREPTSRDFAKMVAESPFSAHIFSFQDCSFHVHKGHDSAARVVVAKELGVKASFTLEASFCGAGVGPTDPRLRNMHFSKESFGEIGGGLGDALLRSLRPELYDMIVNAFGMDRSREVSDAAYFEATQVRKPAVVKKKNPVVACGRAETEKKKGAEREREIVPSGTRSEKPKNQDLPKMKRAAKRKTKSKPVACIPLAFESNHASWRLQGMAYDEHAFGGGRRTAQRKSLRKSVSRASKSRKQQRANKTEAILHECSLSRFHTLLPLKPKTAVILQKSVRRSGGFPPGDPKPRRKAAPVKLGEALPHIVKS